MHGFFYIAFESPRDQAEFRSLFGELTHYSRIGIAYNARAKLRGPDGGCQAHFRFQGAFEVKIVVVDSRFPEHDPQRDQKTARESSEQEILRRRFFAEPLKIFREAHGGAKTFRDNGSTAIEAAFPANG